MESEIRRLRLELKQTMEMYSTACKEALIAKKKVPSISTRFFVENLQYSTRKL